MIVRELITRFGFDVEQGKIDSVNQAVGQIKSKLEGTTGNLQRLAQGLTQVGTRMTAFLTLPIAAFAGVSAKLASDAEEVGTAFQTVFSDIGDEADAAAQNLRDNFGLARSSAEELLVSTGDLLTGFGFTQEMALDLSSQVNQLAVDLASFTNFQGGAKGASDALTKALLGEREALKSLRISVLEEDVKAQVAINTTNGLRFATERQAKAYATLQLAQRQSKNAIGDYARTQDSVANRMRTFQQRLKELSESFGKLLLPIVNKVVGVLTKVVNWLNKLSPTTKRVILVIMGLVAALGPLLILIGTVTGAVLALTAATTVLEISLLPIIGTVLAVIAIIGVLAAAIYLIVNDFMVWAQGGDSLVGSLLGDFEKFKVVFIAIWETVKRVVVEAFRIIKEVVLNVIRPLLANIIGMVGGIIEFLGGVFQVIGGLISGNGEQIRAGLMKMLDGIKTYFVNWVGFIVNYITTPFRVIDTLLKELGAKVGNFFKGLPGAIVNFFKNRKEIGASISAIGEGIGAKGENISGFGTEKFGGPRGGGNNTNITNNVDVVAQMPEGTTRDQAREVEKIAKSGVNAATAAGAREVATAFNVNE